MYDRVIIPKNVKKVSGHKIHNTSDRYTAIEDADALLITSELIQFDE
ncbi:MULTISPECIES: hypothetical protein [Weeksella]|nr:MULTISPECIES: hypothetical protein [Weeksella]MDK7374432.1 hypothetical protein [Weeksella virosa]MDK7675620.1 hypothetical protein [Weeksella virosa]VEH62925.1 Uncharacterised protein [Weeksella virosa]